MAEGYRRRISIGALAHVDAGKTTFSEQLLYHADALRTPGRVDHQDAFLDLHPLEKARGITIFSDQACFEYEKDTWYWVDTPGHVDFSSEMERALSVMDAAVLIISCVEGFDLEFSAQRALSRNRCIHALGHASIAAQCSLQTGGTWDGSVKNLRSGWSPLCVFDDGSESARLLEQMGAVKIGFEDLKDLRNLPCPPQLKL